jgi:ATP-binding cassette subfamily C (CFTR/MRP) protein 1
VVLGSEGKIAQKGTYDTLRSQEGYIGSLLETKQIKKDLESSAIEETTKKSSKSATESKSLEKTRKTGDFAIYRYWFKSVSLPSVFAFIGSAALHSFFRYFCQYWLKWWTEDSDSSHTGRYISIYALLSILALVFEVITILWVLVRIGPKSGEKLHHTLLHTVIRAPQSFFSRVDTGTTLNRFSEDMGLVDRTLPVSAMNVVTRSFQVFAQGILLFGAEKYMSGSIPLCFLALFVIQRVYLQTSRQIRLLDLESKSPVYTQFVETVFLPLHFPFKV